MSGTSNSSSCPSCGLPRVVAVGRGCQVVRRIAQELRVPSLTAILASPVRPNCDAGVGLMTDLYQLTMAYGYWKSDVAEKEAAFHLSFRKHPFDGGVTVAAGLRDAADYLQRLHFEESDLEYLATLTGRDGQPLFEPAFFGYLRDFKFHCDVDAVPEGTVVFPQEPLLRVQGPILQAQLIETALLQVVNFQSLIATKAARICLAAMSDWKFT